MDFTDSAKPTDNCIRSEPDAEEGNSSRNNDTITTGAMNKDMKTENSLKRKPTSKMVIKTIKTLNMSKGAPIEAIGAFMEEYYDYGLNTKSLTPHIKTFVEDGIKNGLLEQVRDAGSVERFKIKETVKAPFEIKSKPTENFNLKNKAAAPEMQLKRKKPLTSEMVLESIKSLKMRKGASIVSIREQMENKYDVNTKTLTPHINKFLKNGVEKGILEKVCGTGTDVRFKIGKMEGTAVHPKNKVAEKARKPDLRKDAKTYTVSEKKNPPLTPAMVVESIKSLKMRNGAPAQTIRQHIEKHYGIKTIMANITKHLRSGVQKGILENVDGNGATGRFKIKKPDGPKMNKKILKM